MKWKCEEDALSFEAHLIHEDSTITKRSFLKNLVMVFDPLGLVLPVTMTGRILFQDMWVAGPEWNDNLPNEVTSPAAQWYNELKPNEGPG